MDPQIIQEEKPTCYGKYLGLDNQRPTLVETCTSWSTRTTSCTLLKFLVGWYGSHSGSRSIEPNRCTGPSCGCRPGWRPCWMSRPGWYWQAMTCLRFRSGNLHLPISGLFIGMWMGAIVFTRMAMIPELASHTSCMGTKGVAIVADHLWSKASSQSSPIKVQTTQMRVGTLALLLLQVFSSALSANKIWIIIQYNNLYQSLSNMRHSLTTRFLLTCISSYFFDEGNTLDDLHQFIAADAALLYNEGITAPSTHGRCVFSFYKTSKTTYLLLLIIYCNRLSYLRLARLHCGWFAWDAREIGLTWGRIHGKHLVMNLLPQNPWSCWGLVI